MVEHGGENLGATLRKRRANLFGYVAGAIILAVVLAALIYALRTFLVLLYAAAA